jgi:hypothetical protein
MSERPFGSLSPQEAQAKSVEARRRNKTAQSQDLTPAQRIEAAMQKKAMAGDVNAAREYREWIKLNRAAVGGGGGINGDILRSLTDEQLDILMGWIETNPDPETGEPPTPTRDELERRMHRAWADYLSSREQLGIARPWEPGGSVEPRSLVETD